ncbi:G-protein coupled receptor [Biomphalaria glabrata]|nr:putative G-protein coupled receptor [Biomphalaria glabrata]KAI8750474.1 G-protein coupled receptor [Biomphalaria glabrata]
MFYQFVSHNQSLKTWADVSFFGDPESENRDPIYALLKFLTYLVLLPIVSILGLFGNSVSILILYKSGLQKSSNILTFALAVADSTYLLGINNISLKIYLDVYAQYGYFYAEDVAMLLYVTFHLFVLLETVGKVASMILPPLIIVERFTAVFFPLHFSSVITSARVKAAVTLMFPLGLPAYFFYLPMTTYTYSFDITYNVSVGYILKSDTFTHDSEVFTLISEIYTTFCGPVCVGFVILGCILISIKIQIHDKKRAKLSQSLMQQTPRTRDHIQNSNKRFSHNNNNQIKGESCEVRSAEESQDSNGQMTMSHFKRNNKKNWTFGKIKEVKSKRTTKILLSVCVVYSITGSFNFISDMILNSQRLGNVLGIIFHWMAIIVLSINSAANFLIYVALNRNFRELYKSVFCRCFIKQTIPN